MILKRSLRAPARALPGAPRAFVALACLLIAGNGSAQMSDQPVGRVSSAPPARAPDGSVGGMGDINLFPKRVVLQGRDRIATVGLYNRTTSEGRYDIVVSDMMMTPEGGIVDLAGVDDPGLRARIKTASAFLRWSPRKITLPGSEAQTVRIMARIPPDLPPGEYRSHFSVVQIPPGAEAGATSIESVAAPSSDGGIGVRIVPRFGLAIPVIVRVGETNLEVALGDFAVRPAAGGRTAVSFRIMRSGTRSAFGNIAVTAAGLKKSIAASKGVGVYPEIDSRPVSVLIDPTVPASAFARGAKLTVIYTDDDYRPGEVLARREFVVP